MKHFFTSLLTLSLLFSPLSVNAQTVGQNQQTLQRFKPNITTQTNGNKIGGINFSGVSGSILACSGAGKAIGSALTNLGGKLAGSSSGFLKGVGKALGLGSGGAGGINSVPTSDSTTQTKIEAANKKESCLDALAYTLAKQALGQVTNKTLNWVNTGFGGNPFYVRDAGSFLKSLEKESFRDYLQIVNQSDNQIIGQSVSNKLIELFTGRKAVQVEQVVKTEAERKYNDFSKDFTKGGWGGWLDATINNQNPLGQFLNVTEKLSLEYGEKEDQVTKELVQGNGFLSQKKCVEFAQAPGPEDDYNFNLNSDGSLKCLKYETVTPGSVIAEQTKTITNSGTRQLEAADELNEVLGAFFDSLLNKLFNKGLQTLGRDSGDSFGNDLSAFGGAGNNIVIGSNGQPINGTGSGVLPSNQSGGDFDPSNFNISNPRHIAAIIKTQKTFLTRAEDSQASLEKLIPNLGHLDYCLPGPTPTWQTGFGTNVNEAQTIISSGTYTGNTSGTLALGAYSLTDNLQSTSRSFGGTAYQLNNAPFHVTNILGGLLGGLFGGGPQADRSQIIPDFLALFNSWSQGVQTDLSARFNQEQLINAFKTTEPTLAGQLFAKGFVVNAWNETNKLPAYIQAVVTTDGEYSDAISDLESAIPELESIRAEVLSIVTVARNRHIATKRAQGITVDLACLNEAYDISNAPISGPAREESNATAQLDALEAFQTSFYNNL